MCLFIFLSSLYAKPYRKRDQIRSRGLKKEVKNWSTAHRKRKLTQRFNGLELGRLRHASFIYRWTGFGLGKQASETCERAPKMGSSYAHLFAKLINYAWLGNEGRGNPFPREWQKRCHRKGKRASKCTNKTMQSAVALLDISVLFHLLQAVAHVCATRACGRPLITTIWGAPVCGRLRTVRITLTCVPAPKSS